MLRLVEEFNRASSLVPYARLAGTRDIVVLPGTLGDADWYDEDLHGGRLICPCCDAPVHFNRGADLIMGSRAVGPQAHFKTNPGQAHALDCPVGAARPERGKAAHDPLRGFRLNLNTKTEKEYDPSTAQGSAPKGLESVSVRSMQDIARLLGRIDMRRLERSYAVYEGHEVQWNRFIGSSSRYRANLKGIVSDMIRDRRRYQPVLLEFNLTAHELPMPDSNAHRQTLRGKNVFAGETKSGQRHIILPQLKIDIENGPDPDLAGCMAQEGPYLIQGMAHLSTFERGKATFHALEVQLVEKEQILKASFDELLSKNRRYWRARDGRAP